MINLLKRKISPSLTVLIILAIFLICCRFFDTRNPMDVLTWDVFGYYLYLPATFIHHDTGIWHFSWLQHIFDTYHPTTFFYQAHACVEGNYVMKYPCGLAILYAPAFFAGHFVAWLTGAPMDGFSLPYQQSIVIGGIIYALIGLWFLRKILLRYFPESITSLTMVILVLGTNYLHLSVFDSAMPHNYLFVIYTIIIWLTIRWHEEKKWIHTILLGLMMGMATLVRPTEFISLLIPLLWGIRSLKERWDLIRMNIIKAVVMLIMFTALIMIQLIYWKVQTGHFIFYTYDPNEKLQFLAPYLSEVLFSYRKGWLLYAPVMIFAIAGFFFLYKKNRSVFIPTAVFFVINLLIISGWPTWWFGGSFGQRALMQSYVILAFPLAAFADWLTVCRKWQRMSFTVIILLFILLNLFQTWQYLHFIIDPSQMTKRYYWAVFGKTEVDNKTKRYLEPQELNGTELFPGVQGYKTRTLMHWTFENTKAKWGKLLTNDPLNPRFHSLDVSPDHAYSPGLDIPFKKLGSLDDEIWLRASVRIYFEGDPKSEPGSLVMTTIHKKHAFKYRALHFAEHDLKPGQWNFVTMDYLVPCPPDVNDHVQVYVWYRGGTRLLIDDFKVVAMQRYSL